MLWWFLILGASVGVVVCVAVMLYLQVKRQMKSGKPINHDETENHSFPPRA